MEAVLTATGGWRFFLGVFAGGQNVGGIFAPESGKACGVQINCYQIGVGLYGGNIAGGSAGVQEQNALQEGTTWTLGIFGKGGAALGGVSSVDGNSESASVSGSRAWGAGAAKGVQLCSTTVFGCGPD